ncbi:MAG: ribonuclease H family protein [Candidatus Staskawiczbacteria bacterium]|nr:ribonuclease H family protein [Candidatus Staskawiczbacteria bacterium]
MAKNKYYAYLIGKDKGITDNWPECQEIVAGKNGAKFKSFESQAAAAAWLKAGADYAVKSVAVEDGIYFDSGTGAGNGVEINVSDKTGKKLLHKVLPKGKLNEKGHHFVSLRDISRRETDAPTNNYGELLACKYALQLAIKENVKKVFGDSKLVVEYWSKGHIKYEVGEETVNLAQEVKILRKEFEKLGGKIILISGGANPADLGFHKG